jgi:hypothetical protein
MRGATHRLTAVAVGVLVLAVLAAISFGGGSGSVPVAQGANTDISLSIDAVPDGAGWCSPIDAATTVALGQTHQVGICVTDTNGVGTAPDPIDDNISGFDVLVNYDNLKNCAPDPNGAEESQNGGGVNCVDDAGNIGADCTPGCLDDNPDLNNAAGPAGVGPGWDCTGFGVVRPDGGSPARLTCGAPTGTSGALDATLDGDGDTIADSALLGVIDFTAVGVGVDSMSFDPTSIVLTGGFGGLYTPDFSCGVPLADAGTCNGAAINKVRDLGVDKSVFNPPLIAGGQVIFELTVSNNGSPTPISFLDDLPNNLVYNDAATTALNNFTAVAADGVDNDGDGFIDGLDGDGEGDICDPAPVLGFGDDINTVICGDPAIVQADFMLMIGINGLSYFIVADIPLDKAGKDEINVAFIQSLNLALANFGVNNDGDGATDEDEPDGTDDDGDGRDGEDPASGADPNFLNNVDIEPFSVEAADVTCDKTGPVGPISAGNSITWNVLCTVGAAGSPASAITLDDAVGAGQDTITSAEITDWDSDGDTVSDPLPDCDGSGDENFDIAFPNATCDLATGAYVIAPGGFIEFEVVTTVPASLPAVTQCENTGSMTYADPATAEDTASVQCNPVVVEEAKDRGVATSDNAISLPVGSSTSILVTEIVEIVSAGLQPNLLHTWNANDSTPNVAAIDWNEDAAGSAGTSNGNVQVGSENDANGDAPTNGDVLTFTTENHTNGIANVTASLTVNCESAGSQTIDLSMDMVVGEDFGTTPSVGSFDVNCEGGGIEKLPAEETIFLCGGMFDLDGNGVRDADDDGDGIVNEDPLGDANGDGDDDDDFDGVDDEDDLNHELLGAGQCPGEPEEETLTGLDETETAGAFEFQLKFNHKLVDITIRRTDWLYSTGRLPFAGGTEEGSRPNGGCQFSIISENDIRFGCVSVDDPNVPGIQNGPLLLDGSVIAQLWTMPEDDLIRRLTPGQFNGVVTDKLDENCEIAQEIGDPVNGSRPGGETATCADAKIAIKILEADLNLDCMVDVLDDQAIAFRYGAFFGNLLYEPWYDLEPTLKDFDIDIKDLQKVFGRNGSTCDAPIPDFQDDWPQVVGP